MIAAVDECTKVRCVIVTGEGDRAFCAGADLDERSRMTDEEVRTWLDELGRTLTAIENSPKVFVAAINGAALGGGLELALACDIRVASRNAVLGLPEVRLAIIPGAGGTQRLARLVGQGRALDMILTGRAIDAEEALSIGLVEHLAAEGGGALTEALALADTLKGCGPLALAAAKRAVMEGRDQPLSVGLCKERNLYEPLLESADRREGLAAFLEKRPPRYRGE